MINSLIIMVSFLLVVLFFKKLEDFNKKKFGGFFVSVLR